MVNNQKSVKTFLHSNLIVPSGMTLFAKSKSFFSFFLLHCAEKKVQSAHPHCPKWGTLVSPPWCSHCGQHPAECNPLRVSGEKTQKPHFDLQRKYFSPPATTPFSFHISPWETASTFSSSLCITITRTPSKPSTRWHTRRKRCLTNKGRQVGCCTNDEMSFCMLVGFFCFLNSSSVGLLFVSDMDF